MDINFLQISLSVLKARMDSGISFFASDWEAVTEKVFSIAD